MSSSNPSNLPPQPPLAAPPQARTLTPATTGSWTPQYTGQYIADMIAGSVAAFCVSPVISAVDKALAENASGKAHLFPSFIASMKDVIFRPVKFFTAPSFRWIFLVYASTYVSSNLCLTVCSKWDMKPNFAQWATTSIVNTSTCIAKDRAFARLFGTSLPTHVPRGSYAAWLARDVLSMGVFFTLPPLVAKYIADYTGDEQLARYAAQFALPISFQFISTPIHLLGYNIYNNPHGTIADRIAFMKKDYIKNVSLRIIRCLPPWTVGVLANAELRKRLGKTFVQYTARDL